MSIIALNGGGNVVDGDKHGGHQKPHRQAQKYYHHGLNQRNEVLHRVINLVTVKARQGFERKIKLAGLFPDPNHLRNERGNVFVAREGFGDGKPAFHLLHGLADNLGVDFVARGRRPISPGRENPGLPPPRAFADCQSGAKDRFCGTKSRRTGVQSKSAIRPGVRTQSWSSATKKSRRPPKALSKKLRTRAKNLKNLSQSSCRWELPGRSPTKWRKAGG